MQNTDRIWEMAERHRTAFVRLADRVFDTPEIAYTEHESAAAHVEALEAAGARISRDLAGIPTAVMGEWGTGGPVIAILGEYDALPELGQEPGVAEERPVGRAGHGCGHNLLGSAAMMAAVALSDWLAGTGTPGRVRYYGCPAEEGGAAKTFMVRAGLFGDVDAAISWHPADYTGVFHANSLANTRIDFTFLGRAAHAAGAPELGRSALDAVELMNVGVNYLREHMPPGARVHYAYLDAGGTAPNVVPAKATVRQLIRTRRLGDLNALVERVRKIAEGAALMTGTRVEARVVSAVSDLLGNRVLEEAMQASMDRLGPVDFDAADLPFAEAIRATLTEEHIADTFRQLGRPVERDLALCDFVVPLDAGGEVSMGSTDVGDVSWAVPTVQAWVATCAIGTPFHSWQLTAQGKMPAAHKGMVHAAKIMAATGRDLFARPELLAAAKAEHAGHLAREPYRCPMPAEIMPPIPARP
ncbi:M20 family metallopeptidase [Albidovulum sp.]|jgi:aminobenzoyl-glutamate utilization protein B|uniref:M20 family metallopeptidase n=1 Tax=Albidovulum sp. TaxID=1872424 RepID=UPI0039B93DEB